MRRGDMGERSGSVLGAIGGLALRSLARHRRVVFGGVVVMAIVGYASANALFLQDQMHPSAFFETRQGSQDRRFELQADERQQRSETGQRPFTRIVFDDADNQPTQVVPANRPVASRPPQTVSTGTSNLAAAEPLAVGPVSDDPVIDLQTMLASLGFYEGAIDGIKGPRTQAAVDAYKTSVGLRGIDLTIDELRTSLRNNLMVTAAIPRQRPSATGALAIDNTDRTRIGDAIEAPVADPTVLRVQAGLKAFGNSGIKIDGVAGPETLAAVREFQVLFRLPATGEIDAALMDKMVAVGLID